MSQVLRFVLAVVVGFVVGSVVNMALIQLGGLLIPPPSGADVATAEGLKASIHLFEPRHFVFPFLAHALGTFAGAVAATLVTPQRKPLPAYAVGGLFLLGGIVMVFMLPSPLWFNALDLLLAYLPCAWLGHRLVARR